MVEMMPARILLFLVFFGSVLGDKPQVTIGVSNGKLGNFEDGNLGGLEPALKWKTSGTTEHFDWEAGLDIQMQDMKTMPYSVWGKVKRSIQGFVLSARGFIDSRDPDIMDVEVRADGPMTSIQVLGVTGTSKSVDKINLKQTVNALSGKVLLNPRYDVQATKPDIGVAYAVGGTSVDVDTSTKRLALAQRVGDKNVVSPSITLEGKFALSVQRVFDDIGKITTSIKPKDSINVKWEEGPWIANVRVPMQGYTQFEGLDVTFKRKVDL